MDPSAVVVLQRLIARRTLQRTQILSVAGKAALDCLLAPETPLKLVLTSGLFVLVSKFVTGRQGRLKTVCHEKETSDYDRPQV